MNKTCKQKIHFIPKSLLNPSNPISINVIGSGGTGSHVLHGLARLDFALVATGRAGFCVNVFDPDDIETPNLGRAELNAAYLGMNKAQALVSHINRCYETNWKGFAERFIPSRGKTDERHIANLTVGCVDSAASRLEIFRFLSGIAETRGNQRDEPYYYLDLGNSKYTGQIILSTVQSVVQPGSKKFEPKGDLSFPEEEFSEQLADDLGNHPSCSLTEALAKQSLFINSSLANLAGALLDQMLNQGYTLNRGLFLNLETFKTQPILL